jgi:hypothetical protein
MEVVLSALFVEKAGDLGAFAENNEIRLAFVLPKALTGGSTPSISFIDDQRSFIVFSKTSKLCDKLI